jgi:hypothetical protein
MQKLRPTGATNVRTLGMQIESIPYFTHANAARSAQIDEQVTGP